MNLWSYILKRMLLMIPTLLGVIAITFAVIQFVPGGPVEQALIELKKGQTCGAGESSGAGAAEYRGRQGIDAERVEEIKALYGFDKPPLERFVQMLKGLRRLRSRAEFLSSQGCLGTGEIQTPGLNHHRSVDVFPHLFYFGAAGCGQGRA